MLFWEKNAMKKIDAAVWKGTKYILAWGLVFSLLMEAVFLILRRWDYTVLLGNLLGLTVATLNFLLMGLTIQNALQKDIKDAKNAIRVSQIYRNLLLVGAAVVGILVPCFHAVAVIVSLFFPRIAILFRPFFDRKGA